MEYKAVISEGQTDGRTVTGLAAIFGNVDSGGDRIHKGAFKKTISEQANRVKHLWMHDPYQPPTAVIRELSEVGVGGLPEKIRAEHPEATGGLQVTREYLDTPRGNEILEGIKAGAIREMSFGYDPVKFEHETISDQEMKSQVIRNLLEVRIWDTSDVTWGMNSLTVAAKSARNERAAYLIDEISALKSGRVLSARNMGRLKDALAVLEEILLSAEPQVSEQDLLALTEQVKSRLAIAEREYYFIGG